MAQFDLHPYADDEGRPHWLVDLQHDHFDALQSRIVAPCRPATDGERGGATSPVVAGPFGALRIDVQALAAIDRRRLNPAVGTLRGSRDVLLGALDRVFTGF